MADTDLDDDNTITVDTLEASGFIEDDQGNKWAVPADNVEDRADMVAKDVCQIIIERVQEDGRFHCQLIKKSELPVYLADHWVQVTKKEVKMEDALSLAEEYGSPTNTYCEAYNCVFVKKPKVLVNRARAAEAKEAKRVIESVQPTNEMLDRARSSGLHADSQRTRLESQR